MYRYNLLTTEHGSDQYGNCEIYSKHCTEVFHQIEERMYKFEHNNIIYEGWTQNECKSLFGHKNCLESKQR